MTTLFYANLNRMSIKKLEQFIEKVNTTNYDLLIFTETNFKKESDNLLNNKLINHVCIRADHSMKYGRGLAIFINKNKYQNIKLIEKNEEQQLLCVEIEKIRFTLTYIAKINNDLEKYTEGLENLKTFYELNKGKYNAIIGDVNAGLVSNNIGKIVNKSRDLRQKDFVFLVNFTEQNALYEKNKIENSKGKILDICWSDFLDIQNREANENENFYEFARETHHPHLIYTIDMNKQ